MRILIPIATLALVSSPFLDAGERDREKPDGVQVGCLYTRDQNGMLHSSSYIITTDRKDGCGLGVVTRDDGKQSTYLVTPAATVETSRDP